MKKWIFSILVFTLFVNHVALAQTAYKYVIIPTMFPDVGKKSFNPYNISSTLQNILNEKGIKTVFDSGERPSDYCEALTVDLEKTSSAFKNKLKVMLKNCQSQVVWSKEGVGQSKDFQQGYAEALSDALSGMDALPENHIKIIPAAQQVVQPVKAPEVIESGKNEKIYKPENLYYNETYFVDLLDGENGTKKLLIINGKLLGYEKLQEIATLTPLAAENIYNVAWITPQGETLRGAAVFGAENVTITLSSGDQPLVIRLEKQ